VITVRRWAVRLFFASLLIRGVALLVVDLRDGDWTGAAIGALWIVFLVWIAVGFSTDYPFHLLHSRRKGVASR